MTIGGLLIVIRSRPDGEVAVIGTPHPEPVSYQVSVATEHDTITLRPTGHLDVPAGRHLLEMARLATGGLRAAVLIDLVGVRSTTPGLSRLFAPRELSRLGMVSVRWPGQDPPAPSIRVPPPGLRHDRSGDDAYPAGRRR